MFQSAGQAEILRSNQKDQYYVGYLQRSLADILQSVAGKLRRKFQFSKRNKEIHFLTNWWFNKS